MKRWAARRKQKYQPVNLQRRRTGMVPRWRCRIWSRIRCVVPLCSTEVGWRIQIDDYDVYIYINTDKICGHPSPSAFRQFTLAHVVHYLAWQPCYHAFQNGENIWNETVLFCSDFALVSAENIWKAAKNCCELHCADFSECAVVCRFLQLHSELVFTGLQPWPEQGFGWAWPGLLGLGLAGLRAFKRCQACKSLIQDKYYMKGESRTYI